MKKLATITLSVLVLIGCKTLTPSTTSKCNNCPVERNEYWNNWLEACAPGNKASSTKSDWSRTTFRTVGVTYEGFKTEDSLDYVSMVSLYNSKETAEKYLPSVILSGSDYPDQATINKGDYLTKLVKIGANISGFSVYYITPSELERIKANPSRLEQELGLPLTSNAGTYLVYKMHALSNNIVFQSHVAPTVQYSLPTQTNYLTCGGAVQTLVLNNADTLLWAKDSIPSDTLKINTLPNINQIIK